MGKLKHAFKRISRIILLFGIILTLGAISYAIWQPGEKITNGRHDLKQNGIWLQHGWIGDDVWFKRYKKETSRFRNVSALGQLRDQLNRHHITDLFPHLCPCQPGGRIAKVDDQQMKQFLKTMQGFRVMPWVGGVLNEHCYPDDPIWRQRFITSIVRLLETYPQLAGIHINIEPMPSGNRDFIILLEQLKQAIPENKMISVAAYPPPTIWHPFPQVHWEQDYLIEVASHCDQVVVMMYDTSLSFQKPYRKLMQDWTKEIIQWLPNNHILLGIPTYEDAGVGYHDPAVENIENALMGIHGALAQHNELPASYQGVALYCEWEMSESKWQYFREHFTATMNVLPPQQ